MVLKIEAWPVVATDEGYWKIGPGDDHEPDAYMARLEDDRGVWDWSFVTMILRPGRTGRLDHVESIKFDNSLTDRTVTADTLRSFADRLDSFVAAAGLQVGESLERRLDAVAATGRKGEELVEVVETYRAAAREGLPPFATTMERLKMSRSALARKIAKARDLELLPPKGSKTDADHEGE